MDHVLHRLNVNFHGDAGGTLVFLHGYGCNQAMWGRLLPLLARHYRCVLLDLAGSGLSEPPDAGAPAHDSLDRHAQDVCEVLHAVGAGTQRAVLVGHSVGATIALLAGQMAPEMVAAQVFIAASPCYTNHEGYEGGFDAQDLDELLRFIHDDRQGWARTFARLVVGDGRIHDLGREWIQSFCASRPDAAEQFARLAFGADVRHLLGRSTLPTLLVQATDDTLVPRQVARYMQGAMANSELHLVRTSGHSPHLSEPGDCASAIRRFLAGYLRAAPAASHACRFHQRRRAR